MCSAPGFTCACGARGPNPLRAGTSARPPAHPRFTLQSPTTRLIPADGPEMVPPSYFSFFEAQISWLATEGLSKTPAWEHMRTPTTNSKEG
jgi:hypothetical protein